MFYSLCLKKYCIESAFQCFEKLYYLIEYDILMAYCYSPAVTVES